MDSDSLKLSLFCFTWRWFSLWSADASAQELAPRTYWPAPTGTNVIVLGYQYTTGDIVTDPTLPVTGIDSSINYAQITYQHTNNWFGRTANVQLNLPYTWGSSKGVFDDRPVARNITGITDIRARASINLLGAPAMDTTEFQALRAKPRTIIGASITVQAPTGSYDPDKLINAGTNRWALKPAVGLIWPIHPTWLIEAEIGTWFYGDNDDFFGQTRKQDPILSSEFHLVKRIRPGLWASLDLNYYRGGETQIGQEIKAGSQRNSRAGATLVIPFKRQNAFRISYSTGLTTKTGGDFEMFSLNYLYAW